MNSTIYLFGRFKAGYSQYPDDYTRKIFRRFEAGADSPSQMMIHRSGDLIYYGYIRRSESSADGGYLGLCVLLNGVMFADPHRLFDELESAASSIVLHGDILTFDDRGSVVSGIDRLGDNMAAVERVVKSLTRSLSDCERQTIPLPPCNYGVSVDEYKRLAYADTAEDMIRAIGDCDNVYISKSERSMSAAELAYSERFARLAERIDSLQRDNAALTVKYNEMARRKKQYTLIMWLVVMVLLGGMVFMGVIRSKNADLRSKTDSVALLSAEALDLHSAIDNLCRDTSYMQTSIRSKSAEISRLTWRLDTQGAELAAVQEELEQANRQIASLRQEINSLRRPDKKPSSDNRTSQQSSMVVTSAPLTVTDIEIANVDYSGNIQTTYGSTLYSSNTMYLQPRLTYNATESGARTLYIKWVMPDGSLRVGTSSPAGYSQSDSYYIYSGNGNYITLSGWGTNSKGNWSAGNYRIEVWDNGKLLKSQSFTIH